MSCPAKRPRPENVRHFPSPSAAEAAGFRACKRCTPNSASPQQRHAELVAAACRAIETSESLPNLAQLAAAAAMSPFHFHRVFRGITGVTPKQYAAAHRARSVRRALTQAATVTDAIYEAGFSSSSRFYESSQLGMKPARARDGGAGVTIYYGTGSCSLGVLLVAQTERGICSILLGDSAADLVADLRERFPKADCVPAATNLVEAVAQFVETPAAGLTLPLDIRGTAFQQQVWQALRNIPAGTTATYTEIAGRLGSPQSTRAVAAACAANPIAVAIPCHRVVRADGTLAGYRWGLERKQALLDREAPK